MVKVINYGNYKSLWQKETCACMETDTGDVPYLTPDPGRLDDHFKLLKKINPTVRGGWGWWGGLAELALCHSCFLSHLEGNLLTFALIKVI